MVVLGMMRRGRFEEDDDLPFQIQSMNREDG